MIATARGVSYDALIGRIVASAAARLVAPRSTRYRSGRCAWRCCITRSRAAAAADEADVLVQADAVGAALAGAGHEAFAVPCDLDLAALAAALATDRPDAVFNLVESLGGQGRLIAVVPYLLEALGVPHAGCPADAIHLTGPQDPGQAAAGAGRPAHARLARGRRRRRRRRRRRPLDRQVRVGGRLARHGRHRRGGRRRGGRARRSGGPVRPAGRALVRRGLRGGPRVQPGPARRSGRAPGPAAGRDALRRLPAGQAAHRGLRRQVGPGFVRVQPHRARLPRRRRGPAAAGRAGAPGPVLLGPVRPAGLGPGGLPGGCRPDGP